MAATATAPADLSSQVTKGVNPWIIAASVMLATFMEVLDTAIASVALPYIAGSLSASNDEATWVLTSYLVANAVMIPASGWMALRFGRKKYLIICVIIFTVASFFCGAAPTLGIMLFSRAVQGAGGGALQPLSQAILLESFPPAKRAAALAVFALGVVVAPVLGPTLGGWLTDSYSWRYAFYINIPVGILAVFMMGRFIHDPPYIKQAKVSAFDKIGFGTLLVWTGLLQVILDKGQEDDWFGAMWIRWCTLILVSAFLWFCIHSWRNPTPLVNLRVLKNRNFAIGCLLISLFGVAIYSTITILPLFYQELLGYTAFTAGLAVFPRGLGSIAGMPLIGYLAGKYDPRILLTCGFMTFGITCIYFGNLTLDISPTTLLWPIVTTGLALSFVFVPINSVAYGTLRNEQIGNASGLFNLMRNVGGSIGISVAQTLLTRRAAYHQSEMTNALPAGGTQLAQAFSRNQHALTGFFGPANVAQPAQASIYNQLLRQASAWSFVEVFRWLAALCFFCVAVVWLLKKVRPGKAPAGAH